MSESKEIRVMHTAAAVAAPGDEKRNDEVPNFSEKAAYQLAALLLVVLVGIPYLWQGVGELQVWLELRDERGAYTEAYEERMDVYESLAAIHPQAPDAEPEADNLDSVEAIDLAIRQENERTAYLERMTVRRKQQIEQAKAQWLESQKALQAGADGYRKSRHEQQIQRAEQLLTESQLAEVKAQLNGGQDGQ